MQLHLPVPLYFILYIEQQLMQVLEALGNREGDVAGCLSLCACKVRIERRTAGSVYGVTSRSASSAPDVRLVPLWG
jgi:hypothetical protein